METGEDWKRKFNQSRARWLSNGQFYINERQTKGVKAYSGNVENFTSCDTEYERAFFASGGVGLAWDDIADFKAGIYDFKLSISQQSYIPIKDQSQVMDW